MEAAATAALTVSSLDSALPPGGAAACVERVGVALSSVSASESAGVERSGALEVSLRALLLSRLGVRPRVVHPLVDNVLDVALAAVSARALDASAVFAALEDVFESLAVAEVAPVWALVEARREPLRALVVGGGAQRARLALLRLTSGLLRRLSRSADTVQCGRVLLFLAGALPLSERSGVNIAGACNVENATPYEGAAADAAAVVEPADRKSVV